MPRCLPHDAADKPVKRRPRWKKRVRIDGRSLLARRVAALKAQFTDQMGPRASTPGAKLAIESAAELAALGEAARARIIRGDASISLAHLVRIENAAARAIARLGINPLQPEVPSGPAAYLARKRAAST